MTNDIMIDSNNKYNRGVNHAQKNMDKKQWTYTKRSKW